MYDAEFDTDWDDLGKDDALERAFALGVAERLGRPNREEFERVLDTADTAYRRSLIELSYEEGQHKASERSEGDAAEVWRRLVVEPDAAEATGAPDDASQRAGPPSVVERPRPRALPQDDLGRLRLPAFLRRR